MPCSCPSPRYRRVCFLGACSPGATGSGGSVEALGFKRCLQPETFTEWTLRFKQCSLHLAIRVSPSLPLSAFRAARLSGHAAFPSEFPHQVSQATQRYHAQPFPCCTGINNAVTRRNREGLEPSRRVMGLAF